MITSSQIIKISEDYLKSGVSGSGNHSISLFVNPSQADFIKMIKLAKDNQRNLTRIRFVANTLLKKVVVTDAYISTHEDVHKILGMPKDVEFSYSKYPYLLDGEAPFSNGRPNSPVWDKFVTWILDRKTYDADFKIWLDGVFSYNWSWLDSYIPGSSSMMNSYKNIYTNLLKNNSADWTK